MTGAPRTHPYPSNYRPGAHWATDEAWKIIDCLPVGQLTDEQRFLIAGQIASALIKERHRAAHSPDAVARIKELETELAAARDVLAGVGIVGPIKGSAA